MFTLIPSLYLIGVHYFRKWNAPYYYEQVDNEEKQMFGTNKKTAMKTQSTKFIEKYDNTSLQDDNDSTTTDSEQFTSESYEKNGYLPKAASNYHNQHHKVKSRRKKDNQPPPMYNLQRRNTFTGQLSIADISYLMNATEFTQEQILLWHNDFLLDCPDEKLTKSKFIDIYKQFYKKGQVTKFCEHAFRLFNKTGKGYMDFIEFLLAVSLTSTTDPVKKIELFFSMYDSDCNGLIDENEMRCVVESIYDLMGIDIRDPSRIDTKVNEIFSNAECDQSGYLRKDQFALACQNDRHIRKLLVSNTKSSDNQ